MAKDKDEIILDPIEDTLLAQGIHYLHGEITEENISECVKWLLYEQFNSKKKKELTLYISSEGGDLYHAFALIDIMNTSRHTITTVAIGPVMSAAFLIFISGTKGSRLVGYNASLMCHQYSATLESKHHDLKAAMHEGESCNERMINIITRSIGPDHVYELLGASDVYLTANEAINMGVADGFI